MENLPVSERLREYLAIQYDLHRVLGEGGMGVVLLATERVLDRQVAIKILRREAAADAELTARFRREARIAAGLAHPNIVPLHTFGGVDGELFFVMGFVEGESLADRLRREGRLSESETVHILTDLCSALALAHERGIVHRDIKPENVLIEARSGRAMLADFGIARDSAANSALTGTGVSLGTPHYMAPEQIGAEGAVDQRADIYSIGVLGYRMLTGRLPFDGATLREVLVKQLATQPPEIAALAPSASADLVRALTRCLEKDPAARWPDAPSLAAMILPRSGEMDELPDDLRGVEGVGTSMMTLSGMSAVVGTLNSVFWQREILTALIPALIWGPVLATLINSFSAGRKHGLAKALSVGFRPPTWWQVWWPKFARRPSDVWHRMPRPLQISRILGYASLFGLVLTFVPLLALMVTLTEERIVAFTLLPALKTFMRPLMVGLTTTMMLGFGVGFWWRLKQPGFRWFASTDANWLAEPTASPRWRRPELARFLLPEASGATPVPEDSDRLAGAIAEQVRALRSASILDSDAPSALAQEAASAIMAIDRELKVLERGGSVQELARLGAQLEQRHALPRDLAEMLQRQHNAVAEIVRRQSAQQLRRTHLLQRLRELFLALDTLRDRTRTAEDPSISQRVADACADLQALAGGYEALQDHTK